MTNVKTRLQGAILLLLFAAVMVAGSDAAAHEATIQLEIQGGSAQPETRNPHVSMKLAETHDHDVVFELVAEVGPDDTATEGEDGDFLFKDKQFTIKAGDLTYINPDSSGHHRHVHPFSLVYDSDGDEPDETFTIKAVPVGSPHETIAEKTREVTIKNVNPNDRDGDAIRSGRDNCPFVANPNQRDTDGDHAGNACDNDDDNDGVRDIADNCPLVPNQDQADGDGDGKGDACDDDEDGDGIADADDNCPFAANEDQADADEDGVGDACDLGDPAADPEAGGPAPPRPASFRGPPCSRAEGLIGRERPGAPIGPLWLEGSVLEVDPNTRNPDEFHFVRLDLPGIQPLREEIGWRTELVCTGGGTVCKEGTESETCDEGDEDCTEIPACSVLDGDGDEVPSETDGHLWMTDHDLRWSAGDLIRVRWPYGSHYHLECEHSQDGGETWHRASCHPTID